MPQDFEVLRDKAWDAVKGMDNGIAVGIALKTEAGNSYVHIIHNINESEGDEKALIDSLVAKGESRVTDMVLIKPDGSYTYPTKSLCRDLQRIDGYNCYTCVYTPHVCGGGRISKTPLIMIQAVLK